MRAETAILEVYDQPTIMLLADFHNTMEEDFRPRVVSVSDIKKKYEEHVEQHVQQQMSLAKPATKSAQGSPNPQRRAPITAEDKGLFVV